MIENLAQMACTLVDITPNAITAGWHTSFHNGAARDYQGHIVTLLCLEAIANPMLGHDISGIGSVWLNFAT